MSRHGRDRGLASPRRRLVALVTTVVALAGCPSSARSTPWTSVGCKPAVCGGNTPIVNSFPTRELNLDGAANRDGIALIPAPPLDPTATVGRCRRVARLSVEDGAFVGLDADGALACRGGDLIGARFQIETAAGVVTITIADVAWIAPWRRGPAIPAYLLTSDRNGGKAICAEPSAWLGPGETTIDEIVGGEATGLLDPGEPGQYALLVAGEIYDLDTATIIRDPVWQDGRPIDRSRWFNVACQGTALAKMRLLGHDPLADTRGSRPGSEAASLRAEAGVDERQATLKMITARYCGAASHTVPGVRINWIQQTMDRALRLVRRRFAWRASVPPELDGIEARWGRDGALCLSEPRLDSAGGDAIRAACGIERCEALAAREPRKGGVLTRRLASAAPTIYWTTYAAAPAAVTAAAPAQSGR